MSKRTVLILVGAWIIFFLFLGFPAAYDKVFAIVIGAIVLIIGLKERVASKVITEQTATPYVEHKQTMADVRSSNSLTGTNTESSS